VKILNYYNENKFNSYIDDVLGECTNEHTKSILRQVYLAGVIHTCEDLINKKFNRKEIIDMCMQELSDKLQEEKNYDNNDH